VEPSPTRFDEHTVFRSFFLANPDALMLVDASGEILLANPAAAGLLGYEIDELVGLSVDEFVPDAIRPRHAAFRSTYARTPRARPMGTQMELGSVDIYAEHTMAPTRQMNEANRSASFS
jgi:PAS domain S-box-containing protein